MSISPSLLTVRPGEPLRLRCLSGGSSPVTIEWSKVGGALSPAARTKDGILEIQVLYHTVTFFILICWLFIINKNISLS